MQWLFQLQREVLLYETIETVLKKKHAYLILAHKDDLTFHTLLKMLDYENNDVFVHFGMNFDYTLVNIIEQSKNKIYHGRQQKE